MAVVLTLILLPFAAGLALLCVRADLGRRILVVGTTLAVCFGTLLLAGQSSDLANGALNQPWLNWIVLAVEAAMGLYVLYIGARERSPLVIALMLAQGAVVVWLELTAGGH